MVGDRLDRRPYGWPTVDHATSRLAVEEKMITWLKKFFTDETAFVGLVRACLLGLGGVAITGDISALPEWLGPVSLMAGGFIRSSKPK